METGQKCYELEKGLGELVWLSWKSSVKIECEHKKTLEIKRTRKSMRNILSIYGVSLSLRFDVSAGSGFRIECEGIIVTRLLFMTSCYTKRPALPFYRNVHVMEYVEN